MSYKHVQYVTHTLTLTMDKINFAISRYQQRIGKYDKQIWEQSVEQEVLKRLRSVPRKTAKVNPDLIDVDLFRGSTFSKSNRQYGWLAVSRKAILHMLFLPLYHRWWRRSTGGWVFAMLLMLYTLQVMAIVLRFMDSGQTLSAETLSIAHLLSPCIMVFVFAFVHTHIMAAYESSSQYSQFRAKNKRVHADKKKSKAAEHSASDHESIGSQDTGIDVHPDTGLRRRKGYRHKKSSVTSKAGRENEDSYKLMQEAPTTLKPNFDGVPQSTGLDELKDSPSKRSSIERTSAWLRNQPLESSEVEEQMSPTKVTFTSGESADNCVRRSLSTPEFPVATASRRQNSRPQYDSNATGDAFNNESDVRLCDLVHVTNSCFASGGPRTKHLHVSYKYVDGEETGRADLKTCVNNAVIRREDGEGETERTEGDKGGCDDSMDCRRTRRRESDDLDDEQCCSELSRPATDQLSPESISFINSNTSLSDTCNSSFVSSTEDLEGELKRVSGYSRPCSQCQAQIKLPAGVRQRKRSTQACQERRRSHHHGNHQRGGGTHRPHSKDCVRPHVVLSATLGIDHQRERHLETSTVVDNPTNGIEMLGPTVDDQIFGFDSPPGNTEERRAGQSNSKPCVSSEDEPENLSEAASETALRSASLHKCDHHAPRKSASPDKACSHGSVESSCKDHGGSRSEGRRAVSVKIIDARQLESTGISSCDSDCDVKTNSKTNAKKSTSKNFDRLMVERQRLHQMDPSTDIATSEWDDTVNTEATSCTESSSQGSSGLSEKDILGDDIKTNQGIPHAASVMNNLASNTDRVSCMIWEPNALHKVDLTVLDIGWTIIQKVDKLPETCDYLVLGIVFSLVMMFMPMGYRAYHSKDQLESLNYHDFDGIVTAMQIAFGQNFRQAGIVINGMIQRLFLSLLFFFLLSVAERTFKQRLLYAKNFCYLTSSRRAKKYELPHFRLNKVRNIKTWLSLRSFLKKQGPQRSVESIVSAAFLVAIVLLSILCIELLQDYGSFLDHLGNWDLMMWCMALGIYLMRFITLGTKINKKYRNFSVLITEQINLYLHMEQKPHKKDELMVANSVLKLAEDLLKELESPFKISGLSANPFLYNITKVVVLSAFSAVLTELLGFKLKLYKIKIRA